MQVGRKAITAGFLALIGFGTAAVAQMPGRGRGFNPGGAMHAAKVVTNEPYSGVGVTNSTQTLSNGTTITRAECVKLYRDSSGRTRREETRQSSTCSATPQSIVITDPVAGVEYFIDAKNSTYRQVTRTPPAAGATTSTGQRPANPNVVETSLGTQSIQGTSLSAQGTQTVVTIPAGQNGNSQPIIITSIHWYSPDLQIVVQSSRTDPRMGNSTYLLSNISTAEPAESLFQLPAGLTQQQGWHHN
jgi:hypothetical protein